MNLIEVLQILFEYLLNGQAIPREAIAYTIMWVIVLVGLVSIGIGLVMLFVGGYKKPDPRPTGNPNDDDWRNWR